MWLHAATSISIDVLTVPEDTSPRSVGKYMPTPLAPCSHQHRHSCPYFSARRIAKTSRVIYADACRCMDAATCVGDRCLYSSGRHIAWNSKDFFVDTCGFILPRVAPCSHKHRHILPYFSGRRIPQTSNKIDADARGSMEPQALA